VTLEEWIAANRTLLDCDALHARWIAQQGWHEPWRRSSLDAALLMCGLDESKPARILDLACGTGFLSATFLKRFPHATALGVDIHALLLAIGLGAHARLGERYSTAQADLRDPAWAQDLPEASFDLIVSATALHWLTEEQHGPLYRTLHKLAKPGGTFLNIDPLRSRSDPMRERFELVDKQLARASLPAESWPSYWASVEQQYDLRTMLARYHKRINLTGASDEGYSRDVLLTALASAGFSAVDVMWQLGSQCVYGAIKA
jgi:SAM-dependent methyltransferase